MHSLQIAVLLVFTLFGSCLVPANSVHGAEPKGAVAAASSNDEITELVRTLEDPVSREEFLNLLKSLKTTSQSPTEEPEVGEGLFVETLIGHIDHIRTELVGAVLQFDPVQLGSWIGDQLSRAENRNFWLGVLWKLAVVIAAALVAEAIIRRLLGRARAALDRDSENGPSKTAAVAGFFLNLLPLLTFAIVGYAVTLQVEPAEPTRIALLSLINAIALSRTILLAGRTLFSPGVAERRVLRVEDTSANYYMLWVRRFAYIGSYGYFFSEAALLLGLPQGGYLAITRAVGLVVALLIVILVMQNRRMVADRIRGLAVEGVTGLGVLLRRLADAWHVVAVAYVGLCYVVWALEVQDGLEFVSRAGGLTVIILIVAWLLMAWGRKLVDFGLGLRPELARQYPGLAQRSNRYFAVLYTGISGIVALVAILSILGVWGVDSFSWIRTDIGRHVVSAVISCAIVVVVAVLVWEILSSVIERYLNDDEDGQRRLGARSRTLLPLLRKSLLIVVATVAGLVVLSEIGVDIAPLLAGAGVVGLAIGFGSQTLVKDVVTGVFILAEDQFGLGDVVRIGGTSGVVEDVTIRTISLRDLAGNVHVIPFSNVSLVENMTKDFSRYVFDIGVGYGEDVDRVIGVLEVLGDEMHQDPVFTDIIREPLEIMGVSELGDSAVVIRARFTTEPGTQWQVGREFLRRIKRRFDELEIEIPFPHRTIYMGETGDRESLPEQQPRTLPAPNLPLSDDE